ncbi:MAG: thioredoxin family protein [Rhizobacter sp.]|nr:thioredoxin family protein [Rhizobacter sp.]
MNTNIRSEWQATEPTLAQIEARSGPLLLEFGSPGCGHCLRAQPLVEQLLGERQPAVPHLKIADGPGRALGRSFKVTLWPTLVFLRDGKEVARLVRPRALEPLREAMTHLVTPA